VIAVAAGVGIAYVSQIAHATKTTYQATSLATQQQRLRSDEAQLQAELARLESAERIVAAAQGLGMHPADRWGYATAQPVQLVQRPQGPQLTAARNR
jgi:cell division protein FtsL